MYEDQVSLGSQLTTVFYVIGLLVIMLGIAAVFLLDMGLGRKGNVLHTFTQKLVAVFAAAGGMSILGYGIWYWQYNQAFGVPDPFREAIRSWWLGSDTVSTFAQHLDPAVVPSADSFQAFFAIWILFAGFFAALLAGAVIERVKTMSLAIIAFVFGALVLPFGGYLVYGSVGPLSNSGTHEFAGVFFYILLGCWALVLAWRARPRPGIFDGKASEPHHPHNLVVSLIGVLLLIAVICVYPLLNGFLIPGVGYFGIALNESGMGVITINVVMALIASVFGGLVAWKVGKRPYFLFVSPVAGWIAVSGLVDVVKPWEAAVTALFAPIIVVVGFNLMLRLKIDDLKVVPLVLLPGIYGAVMTAVFATGVKQGGYFGLEGKYALQHASINIGHQLLGVVVFVVGGLLSACVVVFAVEKTVGLRDRRIDEGQDANLDLTVLGDVAYAELATAATSTPNVTGAAITDHPEP